MASVRGVWLLAVPVCLGAVLLAVPGACPAAPGPPGGAVLLLHEVDPEPGGNPDVISPAELARLVDGIRARGYRVVGPGEFLAWLDGRGVLPPRVVALAFDDGYEGVYRHGYPVLRECGVAAFLFPVAKWYSRHPRPEPARPHLTAAQTLELLRAGWVVGGHGYDGHRLVEGRSYLAWPLPGEGLGEYRARVWADVEPGRLELSRLGVEPSEFAPPYGDLSPELEALVREAGFGRVWVQEERLNAPGVVRVARVPVSCLEGALPGAGGGFTVAAESCRPPCACWGMLPAPFPAGGGTEPFVLVVSYVREVAAVFRTIWDLRGLEHAVGVYFVEYLADCWAEDVPGLRPWLRKRWRLDVPLSSFQPLADEFGGSLSGVLCDLVRHLFRVRCYPSEVRRCAAVGDLVSLVCSRLEPVPGEPWRSSVEGLEGEEGELVRQVEAAFSALPVRWGPHGAVWPHEITEALRCWCGSGLPFLRCCGTDWRPKPGWGSRVRRYL